MQQPITASAVTPHASASRSHWLAGIATAGALAGMIAFTSQASAEIDAPAHPHAAQSAAARAHDPARLEKRLADRVDRVFTKVGASDEQKTRAREIVQASSEQMKALQPAQGGGQKALLALLAAESIDREGIEQVRAARHAQMDERSKVMTRTLVDLAEVLTPAQRKEAARSLAQLGGGHPGKHPRHGRGHGEGPRAPDDAVRS
jgi:Spy/CpxP family protein refolding chaperone